MEDRRLARRQRERQVPAQVRELHIPRRPQPVEVEPGLPDRHDPRVRCERDDPGPGFGTGGRGRVRMDPDRDACQAREAVDQGERGDARRLVPARNEHALDARDLGGGEDLGRVARELLRVEVTVAVDQAHGQPG